MPPAAPADEVLVDADAEVVRVPLADDVREVVKVPVEVVSEPVEVVVSVPLDDPEGLTTVPVVTAPAPPVAVPEADPVSAAPPAAVVPVAEAVAAESASLVAVAHWLLNADRRLACSDWMVYCRACA